MTKQQRLVKAIEKHPRPLLDFGKRRVFLAHLTFVYGTIIASERLIEEALQEDVSSELRAFYTKHLAEEKQHAAWMLRDLRSAGVEPGTNWNAAKLAGMQYYLIKHVSPDALLGYMFTLEGKPAPLEMVEALEAAYGKKLLRTVRYHAEHDVQHSSDLVDFITSTPSLNFDLIVKNAEQTSLMVNEGISEIREAA